MTLLREIAGPYLTGQGWPIWDYVLQQMEVEHDLDANKVISSLPRVGAQGTLGASYGFTLGNDWRMIRDDETVQLTVAAALLIPELRSELASPFLQVLGHMVALQRSARPSPTEITSVWLDSHELARSIPLLDPGFVAALPQILNGEPVTRGGSSSGPNPPQDLSWRKQIKREIKQYAGVNSLVGYVDKTCEIIEAQAEESRRLYQGNEVMGSNNFASTPSGMLPIPDHGRVVTVPKDAPIPPAPVPEAKAEHGPYVDLQLLKDLEEAGAKTKWSVDKLLRLAAELNSNFADGNFYTCLALVRAIGDHIPPAFGKKNWVDLHSSYKWTRPQDKSYADTLNWYRDPANDVLHRPMGETASRIAQGDVPPRHALNGVLQELLLLLKAQATGK